MKTASYYNYFKFVLRFKENKDIPQGSQLGRRCIFCLRLPFSLKWIIGSSTIMGLCLINIVFAEWASYT